MMHHLLISTECCDKAKHHKVVRLTFNFTVDSNGIKFEKKPIWMARGFKEVNSFFTESYVQIEFCPFCGSKCPEIVLNEEVTDKMISKGNDDYCLNCEERFNTCRCLPPEFRWKPKGSIIKIPGME